MTPSQLSFLAPYRNREKILGGGPTIEKDSEIRVGGYASASSVGKKNRKLDVRSTKFVLTHVPTGVTVEGEIPPGHYSKKEMAKKREEMRIHLRGTLDAKVRFWVSDQLKRF